MNKTLWHLVINGVPRSVISNNNCTLKQNLTCTVSLNINIYTLGVDLDSN